jgi:hypothetical protein
MAAPFDGTSIPTNTTTTSLSNHLSSGVGSRINIDLVAIAIGLALAALIRFNILPSIPF